MKGGLTALLLLLLFWKVEFVVEVEGDEDDDARFDVVVAEAAAVFGDDKEFAEEVVTVAVEAAAAAAATVVELATRLTACCWPARATREPKNIFWKKELILKVKIQFFVGFCCLIICEMIKKSDKKKKTKPEKLI